MLLVSDRGLPCEGLHFVSGSPTPIHTTKIPPAVCRKPTASVLEERREREVEREAGIFTVKGVLEITGEVPEETRQTDRQTS